MKTEDLKAQGLTDEQISFVMAENGKDLKKLQKENENLTTDRDAWKEKAETAEETLKGFEGLDPAQMQKQIDDYKEKAEAAERDRDQKLYERDFADALKAELDGVKFTSEAAKKAVMADIKEAGLKLKDGKILGLNDLIAQMKEKDASAFVDEEQENAQRNAAHFGPVTAPRSQGGASGGIKDFKSMSLDERMKLKAENPTLYKQLKG